ncbi:helix-turn-helix transcriptional regulator [Schumannella luteola]|nr:helix-turn-helix transcriptional regulator [Schumannella luteola]
MAASVRLDADAPGSTGPLTAREFEVAALVSAGATNREIAERLVISPKTASAHIEHILAKLGMSRRAEVAAWVSRRSAE